MMNIRMDITPDIAKDWLENHNHINYRMYRPSYAKFLANKMRNGYWQRNENPIVFDINGELKDGQHRLGGVVESGITLKDWPIAYVAPSVTIFDMNRTRSWGEYTRAELGKSISTTIGGAITIFINEQTNSKVSHEQKLEYYCKNQELFDLANLYVQRGSKPYVLKRAGSLLAVYCSLKLGLLSQSDMEDFCRVANTGLPVDGKACEAPLVLRRSLQNYSYKGGADTQSYILDATAQAIQGYKRQLRTAKSYKEIGAGKELIKKVKEIDKESRS